MFFNERAKGEFYTGNELCVPILHACMPCEKQFPNKIEWTQMSKHFFFVSRIILAMRMMNTQFVDLRFPIDTTFRQWVDCLQPRLFQAQMIKPMS